MLLYLALVGFFRLSTDLIHRESLLESTFSLIIKFFVRMLMLALRYIFVSFILVGICKEFGIY